MARLSAAALVGWLISVGALASIGCSADPPLAPESALIAQLPEAQLPEAQLLEAQLLEAQLPDEGQPPAPGLAATAQTPEPATAATPATETVTLPPAARIEAPAAGAPATAEVAAEAPAAVAEVADASELEPAPVAVPEAKTTAEVRELSVPPVTDRASLLPPDAPAWIHAAPDLSTSVHRLFVGSLPTSDPQEAEANEALDDALEAALASYLDQQVAAGSSRIGVSADFIRSQLVDSSTNYLLKVPSPVGTEYQKWVVVRITPEKRDYFAQQYQQLQQRERLGLLGLGLVGLLSLTAVANLAFARRQRRYAPAGLPPTIMPLAAFGGGAAVDARAPQAANLVSYEVAGGAKRKAGCRTKCGSAGRAVFIAMLVLGIVAMVKFVKTSREVRVQVGAFDNVHVPWHESINHDIREEIRREIRESLGHPAGD